jgi:hypothetical protein
MAAVVISGRDVPFPVYGLSPEFPGPRSLNGIGRHDDTVNSVALLHGVPRRGGRGEWARVTVVGPLHRDSSSMNPMPMIAAELLNAAGREFSTSEQLERAIADTLARDFVRLEIPVDGSPQPFRVIREESSWAAIRDLEPDHVLYVIANGVEPDDLALEQVDDLRPYADS